MAGPLQAGAYRRSDQGIAPYVSYVSYVPFVS